MKLAHKTKSGCHDAKDGALPAHWKVLLKTDQATGQRNVSGFILCR